MADRLLMINLVASYLSTLVQLWCSWDHYITDSKTAFCGFDSIYNLSLYMGLYSISSMAGKTLLLYSSILPLPLQWSFVISPAHKTSPCVCLCVCARACIRVCHSLGGSG